MREKGSDAVTLIGEGTHRNAQVRRSERLGGADERPLSRRQHGVRAELPEGDSGREEAVLEDSERMSLLRLIRE